MMSSSTTAGLRNRTGFIYKGDADDVQPQILSDEEQERVLAELRTHNERSHAMNRWLLSAISLLALILCVGSIHIKFLVDDYGTHPLSPVFGSAQQLIPLSKFFALVQLILTVHAFQLAVPSVVTARLPASLVRIAPSPVATSALCAAAPVWCLLTRTTDWAQFVWWSTASLLLLGIRQADVWMQDNQQDLAELQNLMYDAKSA